MPDEVRAFPLLGSIQNDVGIGFLGNQAVAATANPLRVRVASMTTGYASARGGVEGRLTYGPNIVDFRRGVTFLIRQEPQVLVIGFLNRLEFVQIVADALTEYSGIVVLDPVIGDSTGLYVSQETANAIRRQLVPVAQVITPNRFEALLITDNLNEEHVNEYKLLDQLLELGPQSVIVTSWRKDSDRKLLLNLFGNAYGHQRIIAQLAPIVARGAGDVFAAAVGSFTALGAAPLISAVLGTTFASLAVKATSSYGFNTVDPIAVHDIFKPNGVYGEQLKALTYARRFGVDTIPIKPAEGQGARLRQPGLAGGDALGEAQKIGF